MKTGRKFLKTGFLDDAVGGLPVPSITLVQGHPGSGKTTLAVQVAEHVRRTTKKDVLFVTQTAEERCFGLARTRDTRPRPSREAIVVVRRIGDHREPGRWFETFKAPNEPWPLVVIDDLWSHTYALDPPVILATAAAWALFAKTPVLVTSCSFKTTTTAGRRMNSQLESIHDFVDARISLLMHDSTKRGEDGHRRTVLVNSCRWRRDAPEVKLRMTPQGFVPG